MKLDWRAAGSAVGVALRPHAVKLGQDGTALLAMVQAYEARLALTLEVLELETDQVAAQDIRASYELMLPAEAAAIKSLAASKLSSDIQAAFEAALAVSIQIGVQLLRAFVPIPILTVPGDGK